MNKKDIDNLFMTIALSNRFGLIPIIMSKNKRERDANGRFVKSTEPKKKETKKLPCVMPNYEMMYKSVDRALTETSAENRAMKDTIRRLKEEVFNKEAEAAHARFVFHTQKAITSEIIKHLNWFQRRKLGKLLSAYPDTFEGYIYEKNV